MNDTLLIYLILTGVLVAVAVVAGRRVRRRIPPAQPAPGWISQRAEFMERGEEYCQLRADFNYTDEKPATSRVTLTTFSLEDHRREVLSDRMTERDFSQQRTRLRREGWKEAHQSADREGQSFFFWRMQP